MKRALAVFLSVVIIVFSLSATACAEDVDVSVSAQAYVLYCVENGQVLLAHNAQEQMKMASTTKLMTTLLTLEEAQKNDVYVEFTQSMIAEGSSMYLKVGDTVHLSDLAIGMMMASGNDAANAAAITIAGSIPQFAQLMNQRAKELGMVDTHFVTPSGLDDENHYSTALDMAYLMAHCLENEQFSEIAKNTSMTVDFLTPQKQVTYNNHNRLLKLYEYCISGKTGYTQAAGRCLVSAAEKDGMTLIAVTLNAPDDWNDHIELYDYGFEHYKAVNTSDSGESFEVSVVGSDKETITLYAKDGEKGVLHSEDEELVKRTVHIPQFLYAPINEGDYVGTVTYTFNGEIIAQNSLYAGESANRQKSSAIITFFRNLF